MALPGYLAGRKLGSDSLAVSKTIVQVKLVVSVSLSYRVTSSVTYMNGPFSAFLQGRWVDGGALDRTRLQSNTPIPASARPAGSFLAVCANGTQVCTIDNNRVPSIFYVDARVGMFLDGEDRLEVFANINNVLDRKPNVTAGAPGRTGVGLGINPSLFDILGRRFTVGVNYEF
jgi:iron complex outermembrane recepter protein